MKQDLKRESLVYEELARLHLDYQRCMSKELPITEAVIQRFINKYLPHPEGADKKTIRYEHVQGKPDLIILSLTYKHVDADGVPVATESLYKLHIKPTFLGINLKVTSANRGEAKTYIYHYFYQALTKCYEPISEVKVG